jgi:hypothetical protein
MVFPLLAARPAGLSMLSKARRGQLADVDSLSLHDFATLAVSDDSDPDPSKVDSCMQFVLSLKEGELIDLESTTEAVPLVTSPLFRVAKFRAPNERPHDAFYRERKGDIAPTRPVSAPAMIDRTTYYVPRAQVARVQARLHDAGFWGEGVTLWAGVALAAPVSAATASASAGPEATPLTTTQLKVALIGSGHVKNSKDKKIQWGELLQNKDLINAARVSVGDKGKAAFWRRGDFETWLRVNGYTLHKVSAATSQKRNSARNTFGLPATTG